MRHKYKYKSRVFVDRSAYHRKASRNRSQYKNKREFFCVCV